MQIAFSEPNGGPQAKLADAVVTFDDPDTEGCCLHGFSVWKAGNGENFVNTPAREYEVKGDKRRFNLIRAVDDEDKESVKIFKAKILAAYHEQ